MTNPVLRELIIWAYILGGLSVFTAAIILFFRIKDAKNLGAETEA